MLGLKLFIVFLKLSCLPRIPFAFVPNKHNFTFFLNFLSFFFPYPLLVLFVRLTSFLLYFSVDCNFCFRTFSCSTGRGYSRGLESDLLLDSSRDSSCSRDSSLVLKKY